ncbi:thiamine-phosphate kinase [Alginatibacterium sediminis]|uniref:Thiamine-monophosphate kinase n=1 Tax=Alginatibacterium sediminis TaxID=2164068 RepID=A0A420EDZ0_9ALTE|nr:thiamine-phosphate kinase [Alginatibacterium sediminis]
MPLNEFSLIERFFANHSQRNDLVLGIGDDAAIVEVPKDHQLVISSDTLVEGVHFLPNIPPRALGHKALAVNLSDLAAMGAEPRWATLSISLPSLDEQWLAEFSAGLFELAEFFNVALIGGDTTRGPLSITITIHGVIPKDKALLRSSAMPGDWLYVTGSIGGSNLALQSLLDEDFAHEYQQHFNKDQQQAHLDKHYFPQPRVLAGYGLRGVANAVIDISDGLYGDLRHILKASDCDAKLWLEKLPVVEGLEQFLGREQALKMALCGGEDYELCFTVPEANKGSLDIALSYSGVNHQCVGQLSRGDGQIELLEHGQAKAIELPISWDHFTTSA